MVKIKILRNTVANGKTVFTGDLVTVPPAEASFLVSMKKAELEESEPAKKDAKKDSKKDQKKDSKKNDDDQSS